MKTFLLSLFIFFAFIAVSPVYSDSTPCVTPTPGCGEPSSASSFAISEFFSPANLFTSVGDLATDIVLVLTSVAAAACFIMIIISGIKIITAGGDPKKLAGAQSTITYAIIGIAITILAFVIVRVVQYLLGSTVPI